MKQGTSPKLRKSFSKTHLLDTIRHCFEEIDDPILRQEYTLAHFLMSELAVFSLKFASLPEFDKTLGIWNFPFRFPEGRNMSFRIVTYPMLIISLVLCGLAFQLLNLYAKAS